MPRAVDLVLIDLREHDLLGQPEGVVAPAVELPRRQTAEVADAGSATDIRRSRNSHIRSPRSVVAWADRLALPQQNWARWTCGPWSPGLLAGDGGEVLDGTVDEFVVRRRRRHPCSRRPWSPGTCMTLPSRAELLLSAALISSLYRCFMRGPVVVAGHAMSHSSGEPLAPAAFLRRSCRRRDALHGLPARTHAGRPCRRPRASR